MRRRLSLCLTVMAGVVAGGCAGTRPVHYYTITPVSGPADRAAPDGPTILIGIIATPESLQDTRIRYRAGANEAGAYEYHRWTERPSAMVRNSLARALQASGAYRRVLESSGSAVGDYLVRGKLHEFGEVDNPAVQTRISLQLEVVDKKTNRSIWDHLYEREERASGKEIKDVVQSLDRNLQQMMNQVAAEMGKLLARGS